MTVTQVSRFSVYAPPAPSRKRFSPRQRQIVDLVAAKKDVPEISKELGASVHTVRTHIKRIALRLPNPHGLPPIKLIRSYFAELSAR